MESCIFFAKSTNIGCGEHSPGGFSYHSSQCSQDDRELAAYDARTPPDLPAAG